MTEVAVVGAGLMGHALALVFALGGHQRAPDRQQRRDAGACAGADGDRAGHAGGGGRGRCDLGPAASVARRALHPVAGRNRCRAPSSWSRRSSNARMPSARSIRSSRRRWTPDAILASNTSNLDIFPLVPAGLQKRTIIAHWYTPPYLCDLVDLCPGPQTDPAAIATVRDMVRAMGKVPVVFKQMVQGYVANRLQAAMGLEVQRMLDEGLVTPKDIDDSVIHGMALRMPILGIMAKADFTGLPLMQQGMANRSYTPPGCAAAARRSTS